MTGASNLKKTYPTISFRLLLEKSGILTVTDVPATVAAPVCKATDIFPLLISTLEIKIPIPSIVTAPTVVKPGETEKAVVDVEYTDILPEKSKREMGSQTDHKDGSVKLPVLLETSVAILIHEVSDIFDP